MKILIFLSILFFGYTNLSAQKIKKDEIAVSGVCGMCEKRIEAAALIKGVKMAEWDKVEQTLTVIYKTKSVCIDDIQQAVANAGHDTDEHLAPDSVYTTLPACCAYRDGIKVH